MTGSDLQIGYDDVLVAAHRIRGSVRRTPVLTSDLLPGIRLKAEHVQLSGSFKIRGAANAILANPGSDVVAGSSGNHGIAVATLGRSLGIAVTIVMAAGASEVKAATLRRLGARVISVTGGVSERDDYAREYAALTGALLVPSSDHDLVIAGQGTVGLELFDAVPDVDVVFVPTGGGGLLAGVCLAAGRTPVRIIGVEPADARRYARSMAADRPVSVPPSGSIADGLRAQRPGTAPYPIIRGRVDEMIAVTDDAIRHAMDLLHRSGVAAEPSGSVALAGALEAGFNGTAAVVVSGGNGLPAPVSDQRRHP